MKVRLKVKVMVWYLSLSPEDNRILGTIRTTIFVIVAEFVIAV